MNKQHIHSLLVPGCVQPAGHTIAHSG